MSRVSAGEGESSVSKTLDLATSKRDVPGHRQRERQLRLMPSNRSHRARMMEFLTVTAQLLLIIGTAVECIALVATARWPLRRSYWMLVAGAVMWALGCAIFGVLHFAR